ncbi:unnamed protein product [Linum trigynum]|uniref:Uncharacterized protein n=1 Tax=Linum trigynum TaxID=586398 RepID=A0AAV2E545_9ROSI
MTKPDLKHPFIRDLRRGPHQDRFKSVMACQFGQYHCWSKREFEKLHCYEHFSAIVTNRPWCRLLCICEKVYHELVPEFYTTFQHADTENGKDGEAIKFRLGGAPRSMSYHELATALDLGMVDDRDYVTELLEPEGGELQDTVHPPRSARPASLLGGEDEGQHIAARQPHSPSLAGQVLHSSLGHCQRHHQESHVLHPVYAPVGSSPPLGFDGGEDLRQECF